MHQFQDYPIDLFDTNPFTKIGTDWMVVTAGTEAKVNTMTASWGGLGVLWGKNVAFIFVRQSRYTKEFIDANDTFSLTFFEDHHMDMKYLGSVSGRDEDKIANAHLHVDYSGATPFIDEGNLVMICKKLSKTNLTSDSFLRPELEAFYKDGDYHTMYVAEITQILAR